MHVFSIRTYNYVLNRVQENKTKSHRLVVFNYVHEVSRMYIKKIFLFRSLFIYFFWENVR